MTYVNRRIQLGVGLSLGWELHNFTVMVMPNTDPQRVCSRVWREMETGETAYLECVRKVVGDTLYVFSHHTADVFSLCEIVIFNRPDIGENLAGEGKAYRSFEHGWKNATELVDGKASSCSSSDDVVYYHWWRVEFDKRVQVIAVHVATGEGNTSITKKLD